MTTSEAWIEIAKILETRKEFFLCIAIENLSEQKMITQEQKQEMLDIIKDIVEIQRSFGSMRPESVVLYNATFSCSAACQNRIRICLELASGNQITKAFMMELNKYKRERTRGSRW